MEKYLVQHKSSGERWVIWVVGETVDESPALHYAEIPTNDIESWLADFDSDRSRASAEWSTYRDDFRILATAP